MATSAEELGGKISGLAGAFSGYRSWDEFTNFVPLMEDFTAVFGVVMNAVFKAQEKVPTRPSDIHYDQNCYHIALRHGEFHAQIDKAMSEMNKHFLGYGPDCDIIQSGSGFSSDFCIASRTIKNLRHAFTEDIEIRADGLLGKKINDDVELFYPRGAGSIVALTFFFGESDVHDKNWGIQENNNEHHKEFIFYKIDNAEALAMEVLSLPICQEDIDALRECKQYNEFTPPDIPKMIVRSQGFQKEVTDMLRKIAEADFSIIRDILSRNITSTEESVILWNKNKFDKFRYYTVEALRKEFPESSVEQSKVFLDSLQESLKDEKSIMEKARSVNVTAILEALEMRHRQLRALLGISRENLPKPLVPYQVLQAECAGTSVLLPRVVDHQTPFSAKSFTFLKDLYSDIYNQKYVPIGKAQDQFSHDKANGYTRYIPGMMDTL